MVVSGVTGLIFFFLLYILGEMHGLERGGSGCRTYTRVSEREKGTAAAA
jgi:hypothetical protein